MRLHERHSITTEAEYLVHEATVSLETFDQLCMVYSALLLEAFGSDVTVKLGGVVHLSDTERIAAEAAIGIIQASEHWTKLTFGEQVAVVGSAISTAAKYLIREERHGNTTTPGGLSADEES